MAMPRKIARYGWIPDLPDQRDHLYAVPGPVLAQLPPSADLRPQCPPVLDQGHLGSCFPSGTHIRMADGSERCIEDVRLLDRVVTAEGGTGRVLQTMVRIETDSVIRLRLWGHSHLRMTAEHPVLTKRGYVPVRELSKDDFVALLRYAGTEAHDSVAPAAFVAQPVNTLRRNTLVRFGDPHGRTSTTTAVAVNIRPLPSAIPLSGAFGRIIGLFLAEGSCDSSKVRWDFAADEDDTLVAELVHLLTEELGVEPHSRRRGNGSIQVTVYGTHWSRLFKGLCGTGAGLKMLHPHLWGGSREFLRAVLDGWLDGDGWRRIKAQGRAGVTISQKLALAMFDIAQSEGLRPVIQYQVPSINKWVQSRQPRWTIAMDAKGDEWRNQQDDTHIWRRVRLVEREDFVGPVYNLSVEGDESYVAEGIGVHNCTANAIAGAIEFERLKQNLSDLVPSRLFIYYNERVIEGTVNSDSGAEIRDGIKSVAQQGVCPETEWPYDISKFDQQPPASAYQDALMDRAVSYQLVVQNLTQMKGCLASGYPFVLGFTVYESFESPDVAKTGHAPMPGPGEQQIGGHAVLAVGYDDSQQWFIVRNSWGAAWGMSGYFTLPYTYLTQSSLAADFWTIRLVGS
jgi:hypothetical protein